MELGELDAVHGTPAAALKTSPLHIQHVAAGAKFAEFGGWSMPLEYAGAGVLAEHAAVRQAVGVFDVSHLGKATVTGPGAAEFLNRCLTNDLAKIVAGQAQYTLICNEDGGVVDDMIAYLRSPDEVLLIPNAANCARVVDLLTRSAPAGVTVSNDHDDFAILAVQGIESDERLAEAGAPYGLQPAGLAARDTLRTEMGYPLHGQDLSEEITPVQARLGWAVGWTKDAFFGDAGLRAEKTRGPRRLLRGLKAVGRGIPRPGMSVYGPTGEEIGSITSGTFSPTLKTGVALALLMPELTDGDGVFVDIRGRREPFVITKPPFVTPGVREP